MAQDGLRHLPRTGPDRGPNPPRGLHTKKTATLVHSRRASFVSVCVRVCECVRACVCVRARACARARAGDASHLRSPSSSSSSPSSQLPGTNTKARQEREKWKRDSKPRAFSFCLCPQMGRLGLQTTARALAASAPWPRTLPSLIPGDTPQGGSQPRKGGMGRAAHTTPRRSSFLLAPIYFIGLGLPTPTFMERGGEGSAGQEHSWGGQRAAP